MIGDGHPQHTAQPRKQRLLNSPRSVALTGPTSFQ